MTGFLFSFKTNIGFKKSTVQLYDTRKSQNLVFDKQAEVLPSTGFIQLQAKQRIDFAVPKQEENIIIS